MAKGHHPMLWCILLYPLVLFITGTQSRDTGHLNAANGTVQILNYNASQVTIHGAPFAAVKAVNPDTFRDYAFKGTGYIGVLECPDTPQTSFTDRAALVDNGWVQHDTINTEPYSTPEEDKLIPEDAYPIYKELQISTDPAHNSYYEWTQDKRGVTAVAYGPNGDIGAGKQYKATGGEYNNFHNPQDGMIICAHNYSPAWLANKYEILRPPPPLSRLSDVLWFQWKDAVAHTGQPQLVSNLKWIWRHLVIDDTSKDIMDTIEALPEVQLRKWPGDIYDMYAADKQEREIARTLLASPNGVGVVHFLAQHRAELGTKSVPKVQFWGVPGEYGGNPERHMLFHIYDLPDKPVEGDPWGRRSLGA
ncbi:hypothetical protein LTR15_006689 [Elasticomyces elasticus]|nr:hypothetical protein LTR15_006689 [Elasticomyces elasticus]